MSFALPWVYRVGHTRGNLVVVVLDVFCAARGIITHIVGRGSSLIVHGGMSFEIYIPRVET